MRPAYGDNIFELGAVVVHALKHAGWPRDKIDAVLKQISTAPSYDAAVEICRRYITIKKRGAS